MSIHNIKKESMLEGDVYCGRARRGEPYNPLGNDEYMKNNSPEERNRVCDVHRKENWRQIKKSASYRALLRSIKGKRLFCFCSPLRCHAEELERASEWLCSAEGLKRFPE